MAMGADADPVVPVSGGIPVASLPGPRGIPVLGNLHQFDVPRLHQQLENWAKQYGEAYRIRLGRNDAMVLTRPDLIQTILRDRPDVWRRPRAFRSVFREMGAHGLFTAEGDEWRRQRRLAMSAFDPGHVKAYFPSIVQSTGRLHGILARAAHTGEALDLQGLLMRYTVDISAGLAFGVEMNTLEHPDHPLQGHLDQVFPKIMERVNAPFPYWRWIRLPSDRRLAGSLDVVHKAIREFIAGARARVAADPSRATDPGNLLEALIVARDENGTGFDDTELIGQVFTILLGGEDTTANSIAWALFLLARHPGEMDALVADVDAQVTTGSWPTAIEQSRGMPFMDAVINEAMRVKPVAPALNVEALQDVRVGDYAVPAGTTVFCLLRPPATDAAVSPDAGQFRPARWLADESEGNRALRRAAMPFGAGPRMCPGRYLALLEMKMALAMIARSFRLLEVGAAGGGEPAERMAFTMMPEDIRIRVALRG